MGRIRDYHAAGFAPLPIIPLGATLTKNSTLAPGSLGKIPGVYHPASGAWSGFDWINLTYDARTVAWLDGMPTTAIGIRAADHPAYDLDCERGDITQGLTEYIQSVAGVCPIRGRANSARVLLSYRRDPKSAPWGKTRITFICEDEPAKVYGIDCLASGQQYLVEGKHKSNVMYEWQGGIDLLKAPMVEQDVAITAEQHEKIVLGIGEWLYEHNCTVTQKSTSGTEGDAKDIGDDDLRSYDLVKLADALKHIPNEKLSYDAWLRLLRAVKAACSGDETFYADHALPWCMRYHDNAEDGVRAKWDSINNSTIGANTVYAEARKYGWKGASEDFDNLDAEDGTEAGSGSENFNSESTQGESRKGGHMPVMHVIDGDFNGRRIPPRVFTLGTRFAPRTVTLGVADPGAGKTTFAICSAVAIATGRKLTGEKVHRQGVVWIICNEESVDELKRRLAAVLEYYRIPVSEVAGRIIFSSGEETKLIVAFKNQAGLVKLTEAVKEMADDIRAKDIVHMVIDPLVSVHEGIGENENADLEKVMTALRKIAQDGNCSVDVLHHSNKSGAGQSGVQATARGASSIPAAARYVYTLTRPDDKEIKKLGLNSEGASLLKLVCAKANYSTRDNASRYFRFLPVNLFNGPQGEELLGDEVGVLELFNVATGHSGASSSSDAESDPFASNDTDAPAILVTIVEAMRNDQSLVADIVPALKKSLGLGETAVDVSPCISSRNE